ncbi:hypothetical protein M422DRAFT_32724 [Sphaerobolus stellatus SS14]|uniref:Organic hydroperoxide resistance protein n=1 Tax=Sphaerobolus stellatus (strain SS14) TaxID=990650 RepID=A0A0C9UX91_SPHS4|nr:hypothetical protein M422DRAFT_32724 [Sphaerobolus stellatus SS14]
MLSRTLTATIRPVSRSFAFSQRRGIITLKEIKYTAPATASGAGRNGNVTSSPEGTKALELDLTTPTALGGTGAGHNPEQLFASGYASCFLGALNLVASNQGKKDLVKNAKIHTKVHIGEPNEKPGFGLAVDIEVEGVADEELVKAAHEFCPYSRALTHGIVVNVKTI